MALSTSGLKFLANDIFQHFKSLDNPPADEIFVPIEQIHPSKDNTYTAVVRFVVDYAGRKVNSVRIKFAVDTRGCFIKNSWNYV